MAFQVRQTAVRADADAIHDLRVSIRRLRECLRTFAAVYPPGPHKKIRKTLRKLMKGAEKVRSADIALELLVDAGMAHDAPLLRQIREQRAYHHNVLREELSALTGHPYTRNWREELGL
jgi:CHAD domain-containing protein